MLSLTQTSGYAVLALTCLAYERDGWTLSRDIANCTGVPSSYLSKILLSLAESGLVEAKRGYHGGYRLGRPAAEITLADVVAAVEGTDWAERCLLGLAGCSDERSCPTHEFWQDERARIQQKLQRVTLHEIAEFERSVPGNRCGFLPNRPRAGREETAVGTARD
jgi:Rrf2 family protein